MDQKLLEFVESNINKKWLFCDFFDTIVHRYCHPDAVKSVWANKMSEKYPGISAGLILKMREEAEDTVAHKHQFVSEPPYNQLIAELYERFLYVRDSADREVFCKNCEKSDIEAELEVQYLDTDTVECLKYAAKHGMRLAIVSDFYLPQKAFQEFLSYHELSDMISHIFISCDYDARKSDRTLYQKVMEILTCQGNCIMIGDNEKSDYEIPMKMGIPSYKKAYTSTETVSPSYISIQRELKTKYRLYCRDKVKFSGYIFYLYSFTEKLYLKLFKSNVRDVFLWLVKEKH